MAEEEQLDYFETIQLLDRWAGEKVYVTPAPRTAGQAPAGDDITVTSLSVEGTLKSLGDTGAEMRRNLANFYERIGSELALGADAPLELYERQVAHYTFEETNVRGASWAGFAVWRHDFVEARLLETGTRYDWLWINLKPSPLYVLRELSADELSARRE